MAGGATRERLFHSNRITGTVVNIGPTFGWLAPSSPIDHSAAKKHKGNVYLDIGEVEHGVRLRKGATVSFLVYVDRDGLGAERCRPSDGGGQTASNKKAQGKLKRSHQAKDAWAKDEPRTKGVIKSQGKPGWKDAPRKQESKPAPRKKWAQVEATDDWEDQRRNVRPKTAARGGSGKPWARGYDEPREKSRTSFGKIPLGFKQAAQKQKLASWKQKSSGEAREGPNRVIGKPAPKAKGWERPALQRKKERGEDKGETGVLNPGWHKASKGGAKGGRHLPVGRQQTREVPAQTPAKAPEPKASEQKAPERDHPERTRFSHRRYYGSVTEWRGSLGWITLDNQETVEDKEEGKTHNRIYIHENDMQDADRGKMRNGVRLSFVVYKDPRGVGAEKVRIENEAKGGDAIKVPEKVGPLKPRNSNNNALPPGEGYNQPLPPNWVELWSEEHEIPYFWNSQTKESRWIMPTQ